MLKEPRYSGGVEEDGWDPWDGDAWGLERVAWEGDCGEGEEGFGEGEEGRK
jgi:hypothetical protein